MNVFNDTGSWPRMGLRTTLHSLRPPPRRPARAWEGHGLTDNLDQSLSSVPRKLRVSGYRAKEAETLCGGASQAGT